MSSFMKKGKRKSVNVANRQRIDEVMLILEELDRVAVELIKYSAEEKKGIDRKDIKDLCEDITDLEIGDLEESFLWSKLQDFDRRLIEYRKGNEESKDESGVQPPDSSKGGEEEGSSIHASGETDVE